jgi:hypothetical protein
MGKQTIPSSWDAINSQLKKHGGASLDKYNELSHKHSLFIELHDGDLCDTWVFESQEQSLKALSDPKVITALSNFDDEGYLISLHTRDDIEDYG